MSAKLTQKASGSGNQRGHAVCEFLLHGGWLRRVLAGLCVTAAMLLNCSATFAGHDEVDFGKEVFPILRRSCVECHGPAKQEGDLRLDRKEDLIASPSIVAGSPEDSEFIRRITLASGHDEIMPAVGEPLSLEDQDRLTRWVQQGANWPDTFQAGKHWSYVAPVRPDLPSLPEDLAQFPRNEIDYFVADQLRRSGLSPSPAAAPETVIRRVYLDLIGLPPTPAEVQAFAKNPTDKAYEHLVDSLLQRPQFGERWARPWLDLARYADSHGFQRDNMREVWAYRDWVIKALNADMPFDRFTIEQIAGDLLPNASESQKIATGFHRCTPTNVEAGSLPEETRIEQVIDRVNTTGAIWLGTTMECCQCHDHKYDPFSAKDYYGLLAFFNNTEMEADRANPKSPSSIKFNGPKMEISNPDQARENLELEQKIATLKQQLAKRKQILSKSLPTWRDEFQKLSADAPARHVLQVVSFSSQGQTDTYKILEDGSVLLVGKNPPDTDTYQVTVKANLQGVTAFRLDALTHESIPGTGPGRGSSKSPNFVLKKFAASVADVSSDKAVPVEFRKAVANFSQKKWDVNGAIGHAGSKGWAIAPQFKKSHWANFITARPMNFSEQQLITFTLTQDFGSARTLGRFRLSALTGDPEAEPLTAEIVKLTTAPAKEWTKQQKKQLLAFRVKGDSQSQKLSQRIVDLQTAIDKKKPDTTLVMVELDSSKARKSFVFDRGDYRTPGEPVVPATPAVLHPMPDGPANRLTLARWLVDPANPLVARVTVNRWWAEMFGQGLVSTVEDFGVKGDAPSHPALLDWLAVQFVDNGWSMKSLLRKIVLSSTYRQSSAVSARLQQRDDKNRLLARGPRFRMDAEMIRDNLLSVSGLLDDRQFGKSIRPYQPDGIWSKVGGENYKYEVSAGTEKYRRGIYVVIKRGAPYPSFINFDATARLSCTVQRSRTNTPLQALTILNDPVYVEAAQALAARILIDDKFPTAEGKVKHAFQLCTARQPSESEVGVLLDLLETQRSVNRARTDLPSIKDFELRLPAETTAADFAAWQSVTSTLLNLHETITKN